ncbi:tape measure protein [Brachybacterium alimentarium]|uniref:tape measure protein n=1 Tax=Brachybacterium alimentarium TaxID=47845 RepID=UPI003FD39F36
MSILGSTDGLGKALAKDFGQLESKADDAGKKSGNRFTQAFGKWAKRGALVAGAAAGAAIGAAVIGGVKSAIDQQQGQAVLSGLYGDASKASSTLEDLKKVAAGSPLDYTAYQEAAAALAYAGVEGDQAVGSLENVGKAIVAAGGDSSKLGQATGGIMKAVNNGGIAMMDSLSMISESGVPILSGLAEHFGVGIDEVKKMASEGKINITDVMSVMESATGDTFQKMLAAGDAASETFSSQWAMAKDNIQVALGQVLLPLIEEITPKIKPMADAVVGFVEGIPGALEKIESGLAWVKDNWPWLSVIAAGLTALGTAALVSAAPGIWAAFVAAVAASPALTALGGAAKKAWLALTGPVGLVIIAITAVVSALVWFFTQTELGQKLWAKIWPAIKDAAAAVWDWIKNVLWPGILIVWDAIAAGAVWMYENAIKPAWDGIKAAALAVWDWISTTLWPGIVAAWEAISGGATSMYEGGIKPAWNAIKGAIDVVWGWIRDSLLPGITGVWDAIGAGVGALRGWVKAAWDGIMAAVKPIVSWFKTWVWPIIEMVIALIKLGFEGMKLSLSLAWRFVKDRVINPVVNWFKNTAWPLIKIAIDAIKLGFNVMRDSLKAAWQFVKNSIIAPVVNWLRNTAWPLIRAAIDAIKLGFNVMRDSLKRAWQYVKNSVINPVVSWFRDTVKPLIDRVIDGIKTAFNKMRDSLKAAWDFVKNRIINPVVTWFRDTVKPLFDTVTGGIGDAFDTLKNTVGDAWDAIKTAAKAPIKFVVETVVNDALIKNFNKVAKKLGTTPLPGVSLPSGFARGGVLPGQSRMRDGDDQLVPMRRGEGVLVSEGLRTARDRSAFMAANAAGRRGVGFASLMEGGFAGGGILGKAWNGVKGIGGKAKDLAGDALDKVLDGVDFVAEALKDPSSIFKRVYDAVTAKMPGIGGVVDMAKGAGSKMLKGVVDKVLGNVESGEGGAVNAPGVKASGTGWARASSAASALGLRLTSSSRPGARTAGNGMVSLHAQGRARDYAGSASAMRSFFNTMDAAPYPTELLYSPMGSRNLHRSGRRYANTGATLRNHYSHVHVGFAKGGILGSAPFLHDRGGWHNPGELSVNQTRKPEAVLTNSQWQAVSSLAEQNLAAGGGVVIHGGVHGLDEDEVVRKLKIRERQERALYAR